MAAIEDAQSGTGGTDRDARAGDIATRSIFCGGAGVTLGAIPGAVAVGTLLGTKADEVLLATFGGDGVVADLGIILGSDGRGCSADLVSCDALAGGSGLGAVGIGGTFFDTHTGATLEGEAGLPARTCCAGTGGDTLRTNPVGFAGAQGDAEVILDAAGVQVELCGVRSLDLAELVLGKASVWQAGPTSALEPDTIPIGAGADVVGVALGQAVAVGIAR